MKFQPKRFVVELRRGTNRAAFASPDPSSDRFGSAEALLFGGAPKVEKRAAQPKVAKDRDEAQDRRILRSLIEPPEPVVEEPPPVRRGRKPGSKNRPKPEAAAPAGAEVAAERPRRGRKPGSKNKPKSPVATAFPPASAQGHVSVAEAMRNYGFTDDGTRWQDAPAPRAPEPEFPPPAEDVARAPGRTRLRDRSVILKRYVLDLEPRPGHPGALRARRRARAGGRT